MSDYNGWSNYETWNVALWLGNDEALDANKRYIIAEAESRYDASQALKDFVTDPENGMVPDLPASMGADLLGAALSEVNWLEIVDAEWDDLHEEGDEDE